MKKTFIFTVIFILLTGAAVINLSADTVYLEELEKAVNGNIVFQNYSGPHNKIDSIAEIRGIGEYLGRNIDRSPARFSFFGKYRVIHAVDYSLKKGLDADIFILEKTAAVDHIINLRRIISGYLVAAYEYDQDQADVLAEFITVYNAVHRGDMEYFAIHYKSVVTENLVADKAGLALTYLEWPGNTMIVIPLTPQAGTDVIGDLDTDLLSDEKVVEQLRSEEGMGIEQRQNLVELKDKEVDEQRKDLAQERELIQDKKEKLEDEEAELQKEAETAEDSGRIEKISEELAGIEKEKEALAREETVLDQKEEKIEEREERIVEEREQIAADQTAEIAKEERKAAETAAPPKKAAEISKVTFLKISGDAQGYTGQLVLVDTAGGVIIKMSEIDTIRLRGYSYDGDEIISVAGSTGGNRIISLVKIDPETLEISETGTAEVYIDSAITKSGGNYYAVVKDGSDWKIGIFDRNLFLEAVSDDIVFPATDIVVKNRNVIAQGISGGIIMIEPEKFTGPAF